MDYWARRIAVLMAGFRRAKRANGVKRLSVLLLIFALWPVTAWGRICLHRKRINLSLVFAGQPAVGKSLQGCASSFPILTVEGQYFEAGQINAFKAADIDIYLVWMGTRDIERVNTANSAESVARDARVKHVGGKVRFTLQKFEFRWVDDQVKETLFGADRTITIDDLF